MMSLTTMAIAQRKQELMVATSAINQPYIDEPPNILTAMENAEQITQAAGQK